MAKKRVLLIIAPLDFSDQVATTLKNLLEEEVRWGRVLLVLIVLFLFAYLLDIAGFVITTFILLASLLRFVYPQPWKTVIGWALAGSGVFYFIFEVWMKLRLPKGFLGI